MSAFTVGGKRISGLAIVASVLAVIVALSMVRRRRHTGEVGRVHVVAEQPAELIAA